MILRRIFQSEKVKYVIVGSFNTLFSLLVFILIDLLLQNLSESRIIVYMSATIIATPLSMTQSFFTQKYITFNSRVSDEKVIYEYFRFLFVSLWVLGLKIIGMPILVEIFKLHPWLSAVIINLLKAIISYYGHSIFTFKRKIIE